MQDIKERFNTHAKFLFKTKAKKTYDSVGWIHLAQTICQQLTH